MGIRFLLGKAGTDKSGKILDEIKQQLMGNPRGAPIYYIVPEQMTFQQEYALFDDQRVQGSTRCNVVSFSRLAWRILQETGGGTKQFISSTGIQMMLRKIIEGKQTGWRTFQKAMEKQGFLEQLENMITEFKRYNISPDMLKTEMEQINRFTHKEQEEVSLTNKLQDLTYLYEKLSVRLQDKYIDSEDQLQLLAKKVAHASSLNDAIIYFDGFHRFTPQELLVVEALMNKAAHVTVSLTIDGPQDADPSELDLFYQTKETYHTLKMVAEENGILIEKTQELSSSDGRLRDNAAFYHLETNFDVRPAPEFTGAVPLQIAEAVHPRAEVEGCAQEIVRLIREEHYRYQDIAVFIRQTADYHDLVDTIFQDYDIPVFIDEKRTMLNHSLVELIRSALDMVQGNWRYDAVFRVLKTGFIPITDKHNPLTNDAIDELENYVLEYGIRSRTSWMSKEDWIFRRFRGFDQGAQTDAEKKMQKRINAYRRQVVHALQSFDEQIRQTQTVAGMCQVLFEWLERLRAPQRLERLRDSFDDTGQIEKGREQEQVWNAIVQLIDEMVEIAGDEPMDVATFRSTLDAGLESLKFAHVPPSIDHVIVGTIDRSRISGRKIAFLIGVNDGAWPMKPEIDGMINESERELLALHGLRLAESSKRQLLDDWFYMYLAFTAVSDQLWISYPLSDEEGKARMPSQLIKRIEDLFPACCDHRLLQDPDELVQADRFITTPVKTRGALTAQLSRHQKGYPVQPIWWHVLNWYITNTRKYDTTYTILQSLYYKNQPVDLSHETIEKLYPKEMKASVSRLEMYYRCSYQHFAKYSLGLNERQTYQLDAPDIGQLFHEALKKITEWIQEEGKDYAQLSKQDTNTYVQKAVTNLAPILQHQILHSSNRYQYIQQKLQEVIARAAYVLSEQARQSNFSTVGLELGFGIGDNQTLEPVRLPLANGYELLLRGRIDRVDKAVNQDNLFLRIIDYKSSAKGLNLVEVYYGLALQMLAYLDVVLSQSEKWLGVKATPAGVLYFHVHNPMISAKGKMDDQAIDQEIFKKYKMQGLLLADETTVKMMDTSIESGTSQIVPAGVKKNGGFYSSSRIADEETFHVLQQHIHQLMIHAGFDITKGGVHLNPYQHKQMVACSFCEFRSVCQFDPSLVENNYHKLTDRKDDDILNELREKGRDTDGKLDQ
ncbi:helicase-exonuclease AddAB subunit AddB [Lentibacillus sp. N15]|uniref:helicase-exonuclease AddAB subunit AddB n=1 Tax=Lentibacillus songyuanensis TaxID=3136161 RepID=UPI0031BA8F44